MAHNFSYSFFSESFCSLTSSGKTVAFLTSSSLQASLKLSHVEGVSKHLSGSVTPFDFLYRKLINFICKFYSSIFIIIFLIIT